MADEHDDDLESEVREGEEIEGDRFDEQEDPESAEAQEPADEPEDTPDDVDL